MSALQGTFAVLTDGRVPHLFQRVVRVLSVEGDSARIKSGSDIVETPMEALMAVTNVSFEVGDRVICDRGNAVIRDVIWHFKSGEPNFYLEWEGKQASKRYVTADLQRVAA